MCSLALGWLRAVAHMVIYSTHSRCNLFKHTHTYSYTAYRGFYRDTMVVFPKYGFRMLAPKYLRAPIGIGAKKML